MSKDIIEVQGSDGELYELIPFKTLEARKDDAYSRLAVSWKGNTYAPEKIFYNEKLIQRLDSHLTDASYKWAALQAFRPPMAGLTLEDYLTWVDKQSKEHEARYSGRQWGGYGRQTIQPNFGSWESSRWGSGWREDLVASRSKLADRTANYDRPHMYWTSILQEAWAPRKRQTSDYARDLILLNEFLWGEGRDFTGTLGAYLDETGPRSEALKDRLAQYILVEHEQGSLTLLLKFGWDRNVASFSHTAQVRVKDLLFAQDRTMWTHLVKEAPKYTKGKTFQHLQQLIQEIEVKLGRSRGLGFPVFATDVLRREFTLLVAEGIMFEGPYYNPKKLHGLATVALKAVPEERELERYAKEYSHILHLVRTKLEAHKATGELEALLSEDGDAKAVKAAAEQAGKLTLMQTVGLLMATFFPRTWLRGNSENGPYLLVDLLKKSEGLEVLQLISEMIFEVHPAVPTETEWRKGMEEVSFDMPAGFFIPLVCSAAAVEKAARKGYPDIVHEARAIFGVRR